MIFNSLDYLFFLPTVYLLYRILPHRLQNRMLLGASYLFYGWWNEKFLFLIIISTMVDYCCGLMIDEGDMKRSRKLSALALLLLSALVLFGVDWGQSLSSTALLHRTDDTLLLSIAIGGVVVLSAILQLACWQARSMSASVRKRVFVTISVVSNLGILGFFKYFGFFVSSAEDLARSIGIADPALLRLDILLPVGISFYTFQTMSYTLDIYRGKLKPTKNLFDFGLYVAYFPQLVAGPIERASRLLPKILQPRKIDFDDTLRGFFLVFYGLFKKIAVADSVAGSVASIYGTTGQVSSLDICMATLLFAIQIYCDFSGYSDIARGTSKLLGIDLTLNFNLPYFSANPREFWRRWHISLSSWLRDYLYISLGGSRGGRFATYRNLMLTMILGGLWHGAAWNFVLWGAYQGGVLCVHRVWRNYFDPLRVGSSFFGAIHRWSVIGLFFVVTCYGWLLFRAQSMGQIAEFTTILLTGFGDLDLSMKRPTLAAFVSIPILLAMEFSEFVRGDRQFLARLSIWTRAVVYATMLFCILLGLSNEPMQFIYFQF
jgi:D-alanyl-lipoteichoic acid acyltransferase DltB (MBOAT superfamily)